MQTQRRYPDSYNAIESEILYRAFWFLILGLILGAGSFLGIYCLGL